MPILVPGDSDQGSSYLAEATAVFDAPGTSGGGHWYGAVITSDITVLPNSPISTSASMFLDNNAGQVWEFFCDSTGSFGVYDKTGSAQLMKIDSGSGVTFLGSAFLYNPGTGQNWEIFNNGSGQWGVYDKTHSSQKLTLSTSGKFQSQASTLDDGSGNLTIGGGFASAIVTKTSSYTLSGTDSVVLMNGASLTATLPTAAGAAGRAYTVKNIASGSLTVATTSSQTIDGSTTVTLAQWKFATVTSDGSNWFITASN